MWKKIILASIIIVVIAQFFQPPHNNGSSMGPKDISHVVAMPSDVSAIMQRACFDCHSDHTDYPWYSRITPVNWWLNDHINEGKHELNFSQFATYTAKRMQRKLDEVGETVKEGEMPLSSYTSIHKDAKLDDAQRALLTSWAATAKARIATDSAGRF